MFPMASCDARPASDTTGPVATQSGPPAATADHPKVSIIIPIYNEFRSLPTILQQVFDAPIPPGLEKEIIVVDDGSTDGSGELVDRYAGLVIVHHSLVNLGKGAALRIGMAKATGKYILIQDGDTEYDPADYPVVLGPLVEGRASVVYGSRFLEGQPSGMHPANRLANRILTLVTNLLYGSRLTDEATGTKAFRADALRSIRLSCTGFEFCPEVTSKLLRRGYAILDVPISYNARGIPEGKKIRWHHGLEAIWCLVRCRFARSESFFVPEAEAKGKS